MTAVSHDAGRTWTYEDLWPDASSEHDAGVGVGPDGTFYATCTVTGRGDVVRTSIDGGRTWGESVAVLNGTARYAPETPTAYRPTTNALFKADYTNGIVFFSANASDAQDRHVRVVTATHDGGQTWGPVYALGANEAYPGFIPKIRAYNGGGMPAAGRGMFAIVYRSDKVPDPSAKCPCAVLATTKDEGKTVEYHVVPTVRPVISNSPDELKKSQPVYIAGDPTRVGRFAVLVISDDETTLDVYVTNDAGKTWLPPSTLGEPPANNRIKPMIDYSPTGVLGAVWRTQYRDGRYDVLLAISKDGDGKFGPPAKVNHDTSPANRGAQIGYDDFSGLTLDREHAHVTWAHWISGQGDTWYGRVPLSKLLTKR